VRLFLPFSSQHALHASGLPRPASLPQKVNAASDDGTRAENSRSDTIDILDYNIQLDVTDFTGKQIKGHCTLTIVSKLDKVSETLS
jgi:hypothetical protein